MMPTRDLGVGLVPAGWGGFRLRQLAEYKMKQGASSVEALGSRTHGQVTRVVGRTGAKG